MKFRRDQLIKRILLRVNQAANAHKRYRSTENSTN